MCALVDETSSQILNVGSLRSDWLLIPSGQKLHWFVFRSLISFGKVSRFTVGQGDDDDDDDDDDDNNNNNTNYNNNDDNNMTMTMSMTASGDRKRTKTSWKGCWYRLYREFFECPKEMYSL